MSSPTSFHLFAQLPPELQLRIWDECTAGPSMHVFDVCYPSSVDGQRRSERAFRSRKADGHFSKHKDSAFLDVLEPNVDDDPGEDNHGPCTAIYASDPSVYRLHASLRLVCTDAANAVRRRSCAIASDRNAVHLPGRDRTITYSNTGDVLLLRFQATGGAGRRGMEALFGDDIDTMPRLGNVSEVLEAPWSEDLAQTVRRARRLALDVGETWTPATVGVLIFEEVAFLACCLQEDLEVLYLVDHCLGRCRRCHHGPRMGASDLQTRGTLFREVHEVDGVEAEGETCRPADVIQGVGYTYREVFDFEALGWNDFHPTFLFARLIAEAIRGQQRDAGREVFRGVRLLVVEDD